MAKCKYNPDTFVEHLDMSFDLGMETTGVIDNRDSDDLCKEAEVNDKIEKQKSKIKYINYKKAHLAKVNNLEGLFRIPEKKEIGIAKTQGAFNIFTILLYLARDSELDEVYLSTFNMKECFISAFFEMLATGKIKKGRIMISDSISFRMPKRIAQLKELAKKHENKDVKIKLNWNHSKIMLVKTRDLFFVMQGSGNLSDNAQIEQYCIFNDEKVFNFHKEWMDAEFKKNRKKREEIIGMKNG